MSPSRAFWRQKTPEVKRWLRASFLGAAVLGMVTAFAIVRGFSGAHEWRLVIAGVLTVVLLPIFLTIGERRLKARARNNPPPPGA